MTNKLNTWQIGVPRQEHINGSSRVQAEVAGDTVWFASDNASLEPVPEAYATAFFLPALQHGADLQSAAPLNAGWLENVSQAPPIFHKWWGFSDRLPIANSSQPTEGPPEPSNVRGIGQCFSGGVDSFYSLLRGQHKPDSLVFIRGFDIPLADTVRSQMFEDSLGAIADASGTRALTVTTNLREHALFKASSWEKGHGAALAAVGLVLSKEHDVLVIPSSYAYVNDTPWGSHWATDSLWSLPGRMQIIHDDATATRRQKVAAIAAEPLVQRYLRVCWRNTTPNYNCSRCEKCLRTMVLLELAGQLSHYHRAFDLGQNLGKLIDGLAVIPSHLIFLWEDMAAQQIEKDTKRAIHRLTRRSSSSFGGRLLRLAHRLGKR